MSFLKSFFHYLIALAAYWFYGRPAREMVVIGITGTKGKSSTAAFVAEVLRANGEKVGLLSTIEFQIDGRKMPNQKKMTMLGRGQIQKMFKRMVVAGCHYAVVETSSEGILQHRHVGLEYDICIFTNLGEEHSERHGGFDNLRRDKGKIFAGLEKSLVKTINGRKIPKAIIANIDDANAEYFLNFKADEKITFGLKNTANVFGQLVDSGPDSSVFKVKDFEYKVNLPGLFNVYNALAALSVAQLFSLDKEKTARGISAIKSIPGRMEEIVVGQPFKVIVDYAHEPISLTELFKTARQMSSGKIIGVIGSDGGGRDRGKRAKMGEIAGKMCDLVIITDVNCFDEDPVQIMEMLANGARQAGKMDNKDLFLEVDRKEAFKKAFALAGPGDIVLLTAKGTEPRMVFSKGKTIPWDDRAVSRQVLTENGWIKK